MDELLNFSAAGIHRLDEVPSAHLVDRIEFRIPGRPSASSAMDDMGNAIEHRTERFGFGDRAGTYLKRRQMMLEEAAIAGGPQQNRSLNPPFSKAVQYVTAHKAAGAGQQNLLWGGGVDKLNQAKLLAHLLKLFQSEVDLAIGMSRHKTDANELVAGSNRRGNDGVNEYAFLLQLLAKPERQHQAATVNRQDGRLRSPQVIADAQKPLFHPLGVVPQASDALGFLAHDFQRRQYRRSIGGAHAGAEDQRPRVVPQIIYRRGVGGDKTTQAGE